MICLTFQPDVGAMNLFALIIDLNSLFSLDYWNTATMNCSLPVLTCQFSLISLDNDQLSVILIATITTSDIRSDSDGANIVCIISLPTARSNARIRPFPAYCFMPSSSFLCSRGDLRNNFTYIINPRITEIAITTPTAISIPNAIEPRKGLSRSSGIKGSCTINRIKLNYRQYNKPAL